jgi:transposase
MEQGRMKTGKYEGFLILKEKKKNGGEIHKVHSVFHNYFPAVQFNSCDPIERRIAAVDLVEKCACSHSVAGEICGFHRNTVSKLCERKELLGIEALFEDNRGLKSPLKYTESLRADIQALLKEHPDWTDQMLADEASSKLGMTISRSAIARIRSRGVSESKEKEPTTEELIELARLADEVDRGNFDKRQLELNFEQDEEIREKSEECAKEDALKSEKKTDNKLIEDLQEGMRFNFSGILMHHLFLQEIGFENIASIYPYQIYNTYQGRDVLLTLFNSVNIGLPSIESLKLIHSPGAFGILSGLPRSPEKETVRDHLSEMANLYLSNALVDSMAKILLKRDFIDPEVFFIDGHFLPYYGLNVIAKGYFTVRRLAMKGNEIYAISDLQGRPLFFITESNEIDFRPIICRSAGKLIEYGVRRPILVFDRGGYGIHFFKELDMTADFITWAKYVGDKALQKIPSKAFTVGMNFNGKKYLIAEENQIVKESAQTAKNEGRTEPVSVELRMVVIENIETGKRIAIFTNNEEKASYEIALYMLNRWGDSENVFKEMMKVINLNYHPGYDIKELEKQPLVDNPDISLIKKAISTLKKEIIEIEKEIELFEAREMKKTDKRRVEKIVKLKGEVEDKRSDIEKFERNLTILPDKVSIVELLKGKSVSRADLEKKKIYDFAQFMSYNSRERLVELFKECYDDPRDVKQVLSKVLDSSGYIKLVGQTLIVVLDWIENRKHYDSAVKFCRKLNKMDIRISGRLKFKLSFHMSKYPQTYVKTMG